MKETREAMQTNNPGFVFFFQNKHGYNREMVPPFSVPGAARVSAQCAACGLRKEASPTSS